MTFAAREVSRARGQSINLYLFKYGPADEDYYAYTSGEREIVVEDVPFTPLPIDRGAVTSSGTLDKATLQVTTPINSEISNLFGVYPPSHVVTLQIFEGHPEDPDNQYLTIWTGRVLGRSLKGSEAFFSCEPISTMLRRSGLRRNYQLSCPHVLYGPDCRADRDAATSAVVVVSANRSFVTLGPTWVPSGDKPKYLGGMFTWVRDDGRAELRTILRIDSGVTLLLSGDTNGLGPGDNANVIFGCNHKGALTDDCHAIHNNILNFGGQNWIPLSNPFGLFNNYY